MLAIIFSLILDYRVPVDYYYQENKKVGMSTPINRKEKRAIKWKH